MGFNRVRSKPTVRVVGELVLEQLMWRARRAGGSPCRCHGKCTKTQGGEALCRICTTGWVPVDVAEAPGAMQHYAVESSAAAHGGSAIPAGAAAPANAAPEGDRPLSPAATSAAAAARAPSGNSAGTGIGQRSGSRSANPHASDPVADITFTATRSAGGALLLGSSREEAGFDAAPSNAVAEAILARCAAFLPQARLHRHTLLLVFHD